MFIFQYWQLDPVTFLALLVTEGIYEGVSKIFQTGAAMCTAVVLVRSTGRWWDYHV